MPQGLAFCPMRYRLRPCDSENELPSRYNLYNARIEEIENKKTWKPLLKNKHVAVPVQKFHEWIPTEKGKKVVQFFMPEHDIFWVAGLYDIWRNSVSGEQIISFALLTQPPSPYILEIGHDRCPIIISKNEVTPWLTINSIADTLSFLKKNRTYSLSHRWEDPLFSITQGAYRS